MTRLRVTFVRGEAVKYISHLDMMRFWERAFRRAGLPVARSQGFHPHSRFALAAPMAVGVTGEAELMDVFLDEGVAPSDFIPRLAGQMVPGFSVIGAEEVDLEGPSLQALMRYSDYRVTVGSSLSRGEVETNVGALMAAESLPWEHLRDGTLKEYDLRGQIAVLALEDGVEGRYVLRMRLQTNSSAAGRPEQVTKALGFPDRPLAIHRIGLIVGDPDRSRPHTSVPAQQR